MKDQKLQAEQPILPGKEPNQYCNAYVEVSYRYPVHPV